MTRCPRWVAISLLCGAFVTPKTANAQDLLDQSVDKVLRVFDTRIGALLNKAQNTGDLLIARVALELRVATNNFGLLLDDQRSKLVKDLSPELQDAFLTMNSMADKAEKGIADLKRLEEYFSLDVQELLNRVPFIKDKDFYVSSVNPLSLAHKEGGDQLVTIRGIGFGYDESDRRYRTRIRVGQSELPATAIARPRQHELLLRIPTEQLSSLFSADKPALAKVTVSAEIRKKNILVWGSWRKHEITFDLLLFPKVMGDFTVAEVVTNRTLGPEGREQPVIARVEGCTTGGPCRPTGNKCVEQNKVIVRVDYECQGESCGFCYHSEARGGNYSPNYQITDNGTCMTWSRFCDGWSPSNLYHFPVTRTYQSKSEERAVGSFALQIGRVLTVPLSANNPDCFWRYSAKLRTGESGELNAGVVGGVVPLVRFVGSKTVGDHCEANFVLDMPGSQN